MEQAASKDQQIEKFLKSTPWRRAKDGKGKEYYYQKGSKVTQWDKPDVLVEFEKSLLIQTAGPVAEATEKRDGPSATTTSVNKNCTIIPWNELLNAYYSIDSTRMGDSSTAADVLPAEEVARKLSSQDSILEPDVVMNAKAMIQYEGKPISVVNSLSSSYVGLPTMANIALAWLSVANVVKSGESTASQLGGGAADAGSGVASFSSLVLNGIVANMLHQNFDAAPADELVLLWDGLPPYVRGMLLNSSIEPHSYCQKSHNYTIHPNFTTTAGVGVGAGGFSGTLRSICQQHGSARSTSLFIQECSRENARAQRLEPLTLTLTRSSVNSHRSLQDPQQGQQYRREDLPPEVNHILSEAEHIEAFTRLLAKHLSNIDRAASAEKIASAEASAPIILRQEQEQEQEQLKSLCRWSDYVRSTALDIVDSALHICMIVRKCSSPQTQSVPTTDLATAPVYADSYSSELGKRSIDESYRGANGNSTSAKRSSSSSNAAIEAVLQHLQRALPNVPLVTENVSMAVAVKSENARIMREKAALDCDQFSLALPIVHDALLLGTVRRPLLDAITRKVVAPSSTIAAADTAGTTDTTADTAVAAIGRDQFHYLSHARVRDAIMDEYVACSSEKNGTDTNNTNSNTNSSGTKSETPAGDVSSKNGEHKGACTDNDSAGFHTTGDEGVIDALVESSQSLDKLWKIVLSGGSSLHSSSNINGNINSNGNRISGGGGGSSAEKNCDAALKTEVTGRLRRAKDLCKRLTDSVRHY